MRRVAVTGMGMLSALGNSVAESWAALRRGESGIRPIAGVDTSALRFRNGAEVRGYDPGRHFDGARQEVLDRFAQFAVVAAREALAASGATLDAGLSARTAVVTGSSVGGQSSQDSGFVDLYREGRNRVHPLTIPRAMMNAGASHICMDAGITGPALTTSTACASATHAIGQAFWMVRSGQVELALAGGSEAPFSLGLLKAWEAMRVVSPETCRPFSRDRSGLILGEGAAMLVLEAWDRAVARGATVLGEVVGFGMSSDAGHITNPSQEGPAQAMRAALADAGLAPERIAYINAHGTGTPANDRTETAAIRAVFGAHAGRLAVSATKSMHGHALGATGAMEAVATLMAMREGCIPPTANYRQPDPECDLDVVPNQARACSVECALSNSFAFGGLNGVLALARAAR